MIQGINPLHITKVEWKPFERRGMHTFLLRLIAKQPWYARRWIRTKYFNELDDVWVYPACVNIRGQHMKYGTLIVLKKITCKTNVEAEALCNSINDEMDKFFGELAVFEKLREAI